MVLIRADDDCYLPVMIMAMMASGRLPSTLKYHAELFDSEALRSATLGKGYEGSEETMEVIFDFEA